ncbi:adhesion G-protein coupled receptor G1-like [Carassius auratus]|uniref:Adhesion G-protein coupled receptor G1-like n=1 Tax=Carassius auratus TaxID=7957 RepID=A0A6P6RAT0_CARAU|nr:adhesion G-protein coupled receptor G1-like [Carassius auratus]
MSGQKQNLLWLMIISCVLRQITCSDELIIQVNSSDQCFWNQSNSTIPDIKCTCLTADKRTGTVQLNISTLGECRSYNLSIRQDKDYEIRMNEMIQGIKLWILPNGSNYQVSVQNSSVIKACQAQDGILSISSRIGCQNIEPVDPEEKCANALYNNDICSGKEGNRYILHLNESEWICVTCDDGRSTTISPSSNTISYNLTTSFTSHMTTPDPTTSFTSHTTIDKPIFTVKPPEITYNLTNQQAVNQSGKVGYTDPTKASQNLEKIKSLVEKMEQVNKTNAAIVIGDVIGVLLRQPMGTETKDMDICYSTHQNTINLVESNQKTEFPWCVKIPSEAFNRSRLENNGSAFVGVLRFMNMANKNETEPTIVLNNDSYGITMGAKISNLTNNIDIFIKKPNTVGSNASCVSWDEKEGELNWTTFGCETETFDNNTIKCSCSHLTFFSVLMKPYPQSDGKDKAPHQESLTFISSIGCGISILFLADALFIHFVLRKAKSNQAMEILMNMFVALFLLNVSFLSNESVANTGDNAACVFIALLLHYSMLASFTWFFIQALHMYLWLIRQNVSITNYMRKITVLGWVCPAPVVTVIVSVGGYKAVILNTTSEKITRMCWISNFYIHYIVNISFYALVFIFIMIIIAVVQTRKIKATKDKRKTVRKQLMMVLSLFLLFGLTWSLPFFSYGPMLITLYYIFTVLNLFQGIFLFVYYYHIRNDAEGHFSNHPESTSSTRNIT